MIYSLGLSKNAKQDYDEIIRNALGHERPALRRAYRQLNKEMSIDGPIKGTAASFNPNWRRLEDEDGWLSVIYDVTRAADDRYIRILHFVRAANDSHD